MKIVLIIIVLLTLGVAVLWLLGARLPPRHRVIAVMALRQPIDAVYDTIASVADAPAWRKDVRTIELLPAENGRAGFRETGANGVITYRIETANRPHQFVTRIADPALPFGGSWTTTLTAYEAGTQIKIVEDGEVYSVPFRFFAAYVFGHHRSLDGYLAALAAKFGERADIQHPAVD